MSGMNVSITVTLIDQVTGPAKAIKAALEDIGRAAGKQAGDAGKAATAKVEATTKAAKESAQAPAKAAADKAKDTARKAADAAKPAIKPPSDMVPKNPARDYLRDIGEAPKAGGLIGPREPAGPQKPPPKMVPKNPSRDFLRDIGGAPKADGLIGPREPAGPQKPKPKQPDPPAKAEPREPFGPPKPMAKRPGSLAITREDADTAGNNSGVVGKAIGTARNAVANAVSNELSNRITDLATGGISAAISGALDPVRASLAGLSASLPALAPAIDLVSGQLEGLAGIGSMMAAELVGKIGGAVIPKIATLAAGLIGLPGLVVLTVVGIMAKWSTVKTFFEGLFNRLPQPVQAAMARIGAILGATPLGALARGFDGLASYVETIFSTIFSSAEDKWDQLRQLLIQNPLDWMQGAWDGIKGFFSNLWNELASNPRQVFANIGNAIVAGLRSIPARLASIGVEIISALTGADAGVIRQKAQEIADAFLAIPGQLVSLGGDIVRTITAIDWSGAAMTAVDALASGFRTIMSHVSALADDIFNRFAGINLAEAGARMIASLLAGLEGAWNSISGWFSAKAAEIRDKFRGLIRPFGGGGASPGSADGTAPPARAKGGPVKAGGLYMVGEEGQELFVPDRDGQIIDASRTRRLLSPMSLPPPAPAPSLFAAGESATMRIGGGAQAGESLRGGSTVTNHFAIAIHGAPNDDPETFARRLYDEFERQARGVLHDGAQR